MSELGGQASMCSETSERGLPETLQLAAARPGRTGWTFWPQRSTHAWSWHLWALGWLGFLAVPLVHSDATAIAATLLSVAIFVPIHLAFAPARGLPLWLARALTFTLGVLLFPLNSFAHTYFLYAGLPGSRVTMREALGLILVSLLASFAYFAIHRFDAMYYVLMSVVLLGGGGATLIGQMQQRTRALLAQKDQEIVHLARLAERQRIARDLHDVLGHTLSLVAVKADLASRLLDLDPPRARVELRDLRDITRRALADVRQTIGGMHQLSWDEGLKTGLALLKAAEIKAQVSAPPLLGLSASAQTAFAHVLIEACTNIARHSRATEATVTLDFIEQWVCLTVEDNGKGRVGAIGHGLSGLRERLEAAGGDLELAHGDQGLRLVARLRRSDSDAQKAPV